MHTRPGPTGTERSTGCRSAVRIAPLVRWCVSPERLQESIGESARGTEATGNSPLPWLELRRCTPSTHGSAGHLTIDRRHVQMSVFAHEGSARWRRTNPHGVRAVVAVREERRLHRNLVLGMTLLQSFVLASAATALASCATTQLAYDGPKRPSDELAILESECTGWCENPVYLHTIDGKLRPGERHGRSSGKRAPATDWGQKFRYEILPGQHTLSVYYQEGHTTLSPVGPGMMMVKTTFISSVFDQQVTFVAEPGHVYVLGATVSGARWNATLRDATTNHCVTEWC